jgi:HAD superfamily phosphoserine phosphatase-like hydrolase
LILREAILYSGLSVFDLDHTLLTANSSYCFGIYLYRKKFFSFVTLFQCLSYYTRHKLFGMSIENLYQKTFLSLFKDRNMQEIENFAISFLDQEFQYMLYLPVIQRLIEAQQNGHYTVILSSSPDFLVRPIAARLGVHAWKASLYTKDQMGKINGISEVIEGHRKANYVHLLMEDLKIANSCTAVYSDSYLDLPVLKIAGKAIGVVPDRHLRKICLKNGWEII